MPSASLGVTNSKSITRIRESHDGKFIFTLDFEGHIKCIETETEKIMLLYIKII